MLARVQPPGFRREGTGENMRVFGILTLAACLSGCVSSGVVPMDKGVFLITKRSGQIGTGSPVGAKADVYQEANAYCGGTGMAVQTVDFQMTATKVASPGSVALQFRCIPK